MNFSFGAGKGKDSNPGIIMYEVNGTKQTIPYAPPAILGSSPKYGDRVSYLSYLEEFVNPRSIQGGFVCNCFTISLKVVTASARVNSHENYTSRCFILILSAWPNSRILTWESL